MIISCPQCATQYNLPDATVRDGAKARCAKCKMIFVLRVQVQPQANIVAQPQNLCQAQVPPQPIPYQQTLSQQPIVTEGLPPLAPPPQPSGPTFMQGPAVAEQRCVAQSQPQMQQAAQTWGAAESTGVATPQLGNGVSPHFQSFQPIGTTGDVAAITGQANLAQPSRRVDTSNSSAQTDFAKQQGNESSPFQSFITGLLLLMILGMLGFGAWRYMPRLGSAQLADEVSRINYVSEQIKDISLHNVRQYTVQSNKAGLLLVIEGRIINNFRTPREMVKLEVALYDKDGNKLENKQQLCGILVSKLQMQIWDASEIEAALDNELEAYEHNVNIASGTSVPFMVVFVDPPTSVASYGVHVVDAQTPPSR